MLASHAPSLELILPSVRNMQRKRNKNLHRRLIITSLVCLESSRCALGFLPLPALDIPRCRKATLLPSSPTASEIEAASQALVWEVLEEKSKKPVLNLSGLQNVDISVNDQEDPTTDHDGDAPSNSEWSSGKRWETTKSELRKSRGVLVTDDFCKQCPQLWRLETSQVMETMEFLCESFGSTTMVEQEPRLLSYKRDDVEYGLDFLSTMMMTKDVKPICNASPDLLLGGIDGGIQERAVKQALGDASSATDKTSQRLAGDTMSSLRTMKETKFKGLL